MVTLTVALVKAVDLASADYGGSSDPYVIFKLGSVTQKSTTIMKNLNPVWSPEEEFTFDVENVGNSVLEVDIYDFDRFTADDLIGTCRIALAPFKDQLSSDTEKEPVKPEIRMYDIQVPQEFESQKRKGSIILEIKLTDEVFVTSDAA